MARTSMKRAIGANPLDALVPARSRGPAQAAVVAGEPTRRPPPPPRVQKERLTVHIPVDLIDELKDAVVACSGPPLRLTLASFAEDALRHELERLKKAANKGKPFPKRAGELKGGRPIRT